MSRKQTGKPGKHSLALFDTAHWTSRGRRKRVAWVRIALIATLGVWLAPSCSVMVRAMVDHYIHDLDEAIQVMHDPAHKDEDRAAAGWVLHRSARRAIDGLAYGASLDSRRLAESSRSRLEKLRSQINDALGER